MPDGSDPGRVEKYTERQVERVRRCVLEPNRSDILKTIRRGRRGNIPSPKPNQRTKPCGHSLQSRTTRATSVSSPDRFRASTRRYTRAPRGRDAMARADADRSTIAHLERAFTCLRDERGSRLLEWHNHQFRLSPHSIIGRISGE